MNSFEELSPDELFSFNGGVSWNDVGLYVTGTAGGAIGAKGGSVWGAKIGMLGGPAGSVAGAIIGGATGIILYTMFD